MIVTKYEVSEKELQRITRSAESAKAWQDKMSIHEKTHQADLDKAQNALYNKMVALQPEWVNIEGVEVLQSPGSSFVAVPCSGRKNSRRFDIIDLNDRTDIVCQLTSKEVYGWLAKKACD